MKNVRIIRTDESAVSPVIATILMVAITVVLAAVLYVMVSGLIGGPNGAPKAMGVNISRSADGTNWTLLISSSPSGLLLSDTRLTIRSPGGSIISTMNAKPFSTLTQASWGTNGALFQGDGDTQVEATESVLLRNAGSTPTYGPNSRVEISDGTHVLFTGRISGSAAPSVVVSVVRSPDPPYTYTLTFDSALPGMTPTNTLVAAWNPQGNPLVPPTPLADFNQNPLAPICDFTDQGAIGIVDAGDNVMCGVTKFPQGGTVQVSDALGVLWSGTLPP